MKGFRTERKDMEKQTFNIESLPKSVDELKAMPEAALTTPFMTAALAVAVLCHYGEDKQVTFDMLDVLKGPQPLSVYDKQFIRDWLKDNNLAGDASIKSIPADIVQKTSDLYHECQKRICG